MRARNLEPNKLFPLNFPRAFIIWRTPGLVYDTATPHPEQQPISSAQETANVTEELLR